MKKKFKYILITVLLFLLCFLMVIFYCNNNTKDVLDNKNTENKVPGLISIMLEEKRGSGVYKISKSNKWPSKNYVFNEEMSYCKNNSVLTWNENDNSVSVKVNKADNCFVYFDVEPGDINVYVHRQPSTYGQIGNVRCHGSDITYNQKYNRIEVTNINTKYEQCSLDFEERETKTNLADYITSLAGTEQGTGKVVKEIANIPDYSSAVAISENSYASQSIFSSTSSSSTSGTTVSGVFEFADNQWTSVPSAMTSDTYYHFKFNPSESGYYQMCYDLSAGNSNNRLYVYVNTTARVFGWSSYLSASTSASKNECIDFGYVSTSDYIRIVQRAYTDIATLSFSMKKVTSVQENVNGGIRYEGKNPNNYIWFNNEYWRIIGVFDESSHGVSGKNLVKIIREEILDGLTWDKSSTNDWTTSSLNSLLNGAYYNAQDGTNSGYCYGDGTTVTANCDYTKRGIQSGYRGFIANVTWYLGGYSSTSATAEAFYGYERGTRVYSSGRPTSTTGYIGLMYPSDYGYSVLSSSCTRITNLSSYNSSICGGQSWLNGKGYEWTLTPYSSSVFPLYPGGSLGLFGFLSSSYVVRPVLYLNASVYNIEGDGSLENPYMVGM